MLGHVRVDGGGDCSVIGERATRETRLLLLVAA